MTVSSLQTSLAFDVSAELVRLAGVDEAGRGPLAGPVMAAAVILNPLRPIDGIADSKQLSEQQRDSLAVEIKAHALAWSVASADVDEIDRLNILQASLLAMRRALLGLGIAPTHVQVDGNRAPSLAGSGLTCTIQTIVKGDATEAAIGAASILAKTARDALMVGYDAQYPGYGFAAHKGYSTSTHLAALRKLGACPIHRQSFAPVKSVLTYSLQPPASSLP